MRREVVYILTICIGLWVDQNGTEWPLKGEYIVDIVVWSIFASIYARGERVERIEMLTVLAFATPDGIYTSTVLHWFLFDLGRRFSKQVWHLYDIKEYRVALFGFMQGGNDA